MKEKLGDLTNILTGKLDANESSPNGEYPFFTCSREPMRINSYSYDCECVLVAGNGDLNVKYYNGKFDAYQRTYIIKENGDGKLYMPYLYYFMDSYLEELRKLAIGGVIKYIKIGNLTEALIELPDIQKQKAIVCILSKVKGLIDIHEQELKELDNLPKARFVELFGNPDNNKRFEYVPFEKVLDYMGDIGSNGSNKVVVEHLNMKDEEDYALMVRFQNFTKNDFQRDIKYISKESYDFFKKSQLHGGELIICKIGSAGRNYIMPNLNRPVSLGLNQIMVRVNSLVLMPYLYHYLHTDYGEHLIADCINGAVTKSITKTALKKIPILLPPIEKQETFQEFVTQVDKTKVVVQKSLEETQKLFDSLMKQYFG